MAAPRRMLKKRREKKIRTTRDAIYIANFARMGPEPVMAGKTFTDPQLGDIYNWYARMVSEADTAREYIVDYLIKIGKPQHAKMAKRIPDARIPYTAAWIARIMTLGGTVPDRTKEFFVSRLQTALSRVTAENVKVAEKEKDPVNIQMRIREKARDIIGMVEHELDTIGADFNVYDFMKKNEFPSMYSKYIVDYYSKLLDELNEVVKTKDEDLKYAYRNIKKPRLKLRIDFYTKLIEDAELYGRNAKKERKQRAKKVPTAEKVLKRVTYLKEAPQYKLVSVAPETILGSQELWTFNVKYKFITVFRAKDQGGLGIKGVSVVDYDDKTSFTMYATKKTEERIKEVLDGGKVTLRKLSDTLKHYPKLMMRLNDNSVLMRVVK